MKFVIEKSAWGYSVVKVDGYTREEVEKHD